MPRKSENHEKIIEVAKKEFLEKGFEKASMRSIGSQVGLTQAALYRHFKSKEDMFDILVSPAIEELKKLTEKHIERQYGLVESSGANELFADNNTVIVKDLLYNYKDEFKLLLCCAHGTKYAYFVHEFVVNQEKRMLEAFNFLKAKGKNVREISRDEMHIILSAYTTAIFEPIVHDWPLEKALHNLSIVEVFFAAGFKEIMGFNKEEK